MSEPLFASLSPTLLARKGGAKPAMRPQLAPLPENFGEGVDEDELEDLGWNDMGGDDGAPDHSSDYVAAIDFESHRDDLPGDDLIVDPLKGARIVSISNRQTLDPAATPKAANEDTPGISPLMRHQDKNPTRSVLADAAMEQGECDADSDESPEEAPQGPLLHKPKPATGPRTGLRTGPVTGHATRALARDRSRAAERRAAFTLRLDPERHLKLRLASTIQGVSAQALLTDALDTMLAEFEELDAIAARMKRH